MQGQQQRTTTLAEKMDIVTGLALFPAMTIMVFLRRKLGYRFLSPIRYQVMVLLIWALAGFSIVSGNTASVLALSLFGLVVLILASVERYLRWRDIKQGVSWHTYSRGISWFSFLPLRETTVKRFIDPAAAAIIGLLLSFLFPWLGYYIIFSAACLFIFESADYQRSINLMLDQLDSLVESEIVSGNVAYYAGDGAATERPLEQTAGIPTGTDPDLAAAIERRRARMQAAPQQTPYPPQYPPATPYPQQQAPAAGADQQESTTPQSQRRLPPDNLANV